MGRESCRRPRFLGELGFGDYLRTAMPEVINGYVSRRAFAVGPWELAVMRGDIDGLCFGTSGGGGPGAELEWLNNSE